MIELKIKHNNNIIQLITPLFVNYKNPSQGKLLMGMVPKK